MNEDSPPYQRDEDWEIIEVEIIDEPHRVYVFDPDDAEVWMDRP